MEKKVQHIFLAEDDCDDSFLFKEALYEITNDVTLSVAENGEHLMQILRKGNYIPDIIFLDVNMPLKNGLSCLEEIRQYPEYSNVPVIMFSTSSDKHLVVTAYAKGANLYIRKPSSYPELKNIIQNFLYNGMQILKDTAVERYTLKA